MQNNEQGEYAIQFEATTIFLIVYGVHMNIFIHSLCIKYFSFITIVHVFTPNVVFILESIMINMY